jgi:hypothetical protein
MAIAIGFFGKGKNDDNATALRDVRFTHRHCTHPVLQRDGRTSRSRIVLTCACSFEVVIPVASLAMEAILKTARDGTIRPLRAGTITSNRTSPIAVYRAAI